MQRIAMHSMVVRNFVRKWSSQPKVIPRDVCVKPKAGALPYHEIPAARRLPFIGTTLDLIAAGSAPKLHKFIDGRHQKLGPIFREPLGPVEAVFLSCPKAMRNLFLHEGQYPTHPLPDSWLIYNKKHGCQRGLLFMDGEEWYENRRQMNALLLAGNENAFKVAVDYATQKLIKSWQNECKRSSDYYVIANLEQSLYDWSIDVILYIMLGNSYENTSATLRATIHEFSNNVHEIFNDSSKLMTFPAKIAEIFNLEVWKQFETNVSKVLQLGSQVFDKSLAELGSGNGILSEMFQRGMDLEIARRIFLDFIIAAGDTTTFSSIWALYSLATNEVVQNETRARVCENKTGDENHLKRVVRETLRLYPIAPFIGRFLPKDAVIGDYEIPKGTLVLLSLYTSGRDETNFTDASKFYPDRWVRDDNGKLCGVMQPNGTLPFALGSRSCIGRKVAMLQMQCLLGSVISNFHIKCLNERPVDIVLRLVATPDADIKLSLKPIV